MPEGSTDGTCRTLRDECFSQENAAGTDLAMSRPFLAQTLSPAAFGAGSAL